MSEETIQRGSHSKNFTSLGNELLQTRRISLAAKGLLVELLSRPTDWKVCVKQLTQPGVLGGKKVRRLLRELIDAGYVKDKERRGGGSEPFYYTPYIVREQPYLENPEPGTRRVDSGDIETGAAETTPLQKTDEEKTKKKKTNPPKFSAGLVREEKRKKSSDTPDGSPSEEMEKPKAQKAAGPMYALIAAINKRLATRLQIKPGMKLYKEIVDTHVVITFPGGFEFDFGPMCEHYDESEVFKGWVDAKIEAAVKQGGEPGDMSLRKRIKNFIRKFDSTYKPYAEYRTQHAGNHHTCQQRFVKALEAHRAQEDANPLEKYRAKYMRVHQYQGVLDGERLKWVGVHDARGERAIREGTASIMDYKQHWEAELPRFPEEREWLDQYNARFDYGD